MESENNLNFKLFENGKEFKMILELFWDDANKNSYRIAILEQKNNMYFLYIDELNLKRATKNGCLGISNINFLKSKYISKELFKFFKSRIPEKNHPRINKILKSYNLQKYDEMELLKATEGKLETDRYYLEERLL